jgi:thiosulfate/3-mercaptopyruvate sulfurtransferase
MPLAQLITAKQLAARLQQPDLCLFDCRFALEDRDYGERSYASAHIPGACFLDLERDLSGTVVPGRTGRHPLPGHDSLIARLQAFGLNSGSDVVLYDDGPGAFAARAWWLLTWLGKRDGVYLLDGGLRAWREADLPLTSAQPEPERGTFAGEPDARLVIEADELLQRLHDPQQTLLDARALPRFLGQVEPIDPVAGHIPGAVCAAFTENLDENGRFLSGGQLRARFDALLQDRPTDRVVGYCGSGVTACHNLFAMSLAGLSLARLYPGSWSEWITETSRPVA